MSEDVEAAIDAVIARLKKGTRRVHLASGEVWRVVGAAPRDCVRIAREPDGEIQTVAAYYWLSESWGTPESRPGNSS